jgi:U3 small nucleolar RNA-associated protein 10
MVSSLAAQLAQGASLNAALLADRTRRGPTQSYLFTGRSADEHDLESIYALGINGLLQLRRLDPAFDAFEETLFSDRAKATDRTMQTKDANEELDKVVWEFLEALGPWVLEAPAGKVLEYLVRRFR